MTELVLAQRYDEIIDASGIDRTELLPYLDAFFVGYVEALLWSEGCRGMIQHPDHEHAYAERPEDCDTSLDRFYDGGDLGADAMVEIINDVLDFVVMNWADLQEFARLTQRPADYAGHDFLLTRNHHGAGFWDRGAGEVGERLTAASDPYGDTSAYVGDDGKVYVEG
jgi:hypothetical protein